jgi:hypothetical protein
MVRTTLTVVAVALLALSASPAFAQITTATVTGSVRDATGAVIPGATVVLTSDTRGTKLADVITNAAGDFVFPNVTADTYTVQVTVEGFKASKRSGIAVSPGDRVVIPAMALELGSLAETVVVAAEAPVLQLASGERSFSIATESVQNLPIANRSFTALASIAPGVSGANPSRIGGGGGNNIMIDGVSAVDTGSNAILLQMNVEAIAEVKVLTSGYQAEYGRSSGLQITAVTKSGTNHFRGSLYDVERHDQWNENSKTNILNGDAKAVQQERDLGYSIGGPIGKPGHNNKLFFFYAQEFAPRSQGGALNRFRVPTDAERNGDFSNTVDETGKLFNWIRDPNMPAGTCVATPTGDHSGCFADGGVLGKIPANRFYKFGQAILNQYPHSNINGAGLAYNYETVQPTEKALAWEPAIRVDYQPSANLRMTYKYLGFRQKVQSFLGAMPSITESRLYKPVVSSTSVTVNYTLNPTMFLEGTVGHSQNELTGCAPGQNNTSPVFCTSAIPEAALSNAVNAGLGDLPRLFGGVTSNGVPLSSNYYASTVLQAMKPPMFQNGVMLKTPNFTFGPGSATGSGHIAFANAPPNSPFAGYLNKNSTYDISTSLTKVAGDHTFKAGFYNTHSWKAQQQNSGATFGTYNFNNSTGNPLDTGFAYANALLGIVNSYNQLGTGDGSAPNYIEGTYVYNNTEGYIQDNWKVNSRLTLDYGIRFVHQQPQYDSLGQASNFLPEKYAIGQAPALYVAGCANGAATCTGTNRQAVNPVSGVGLGVGSSAAIGTLVPNTGIAGGLNGLFLSGKGIATTTYTWPTMGYAPRVGGAFDVSGNQTMLVRGALGLYFDRPSGNSIYAQVTNPPSVLNATVYNADLAQLARAVTVASAPSLNVFQYAGGLPSSLQWNTGVQMTLPWSSSLDLAYVGQHAWNQYQGINLNAVDFGAAFLPQYQDPTQAVTVLGSNIVANDQMRAIKGYGSITQQNSRGWNTYHSIQATFQRRFTRGLSFGFSDSISLSNIGSTAARLQHNADGSYTYRADQAEADAKLQTDPVRHTMKANLVWALPGIQSESTVLKAIGLLANDWQLSGVWTASTGAPYQVGFNYSSNGSNANLTGSPDYGARIYVVGDPGSGCNNADVYRQFNTAAFKGPGVNSLGLESGNNYLKGCFQEVTDVALARTIRLGGGRSFQLRVDVFNLWNEAIVTNRATTLSLSSPSDPLANTAPVFDPATGLLNNGINLTSTGAVSPNRSQPKNAGFGVATAYQNPRTVQAQIRFAF